jgi:hypothetical protein
MIRTIVGFATFRHETCQMTFLGTPKIPETIRRELGVPHRVLDVAMAKPSLQRPGVVLLSPAAARMPVLVSMLFWGLAAWSYFPAQQARLISVAGMKLASFALSVAARR